MPPAAAAPAVPAAPTDARAALFESIAELKTAFLHAVAFCRPLLSSDAATAGGSRVEGSLASPSITMALSDADKLAFYAYFKQATHGDCPEPANDDDVSMMTHHDGSDGSGHTPRDGAAAAGDAAAAAALLAVSKAKRDAWRRCAAMRRRDAMRAFVLLLDKAVPGWDAVPGGGSGTH